MAGYGLIPAYHLTGGTIRTREYTIASTYAANIFTGDVALLVDAGTIEVATATDLPCGVFMGCQYVDSSGNQVFSRYWPSGITATKIKAHVVDDPYVVFKIQADQDTNPLVATNIGSLGEIIMTAGSTVTGQSGHVLDSSDVVAADASAATRQMYFLGSAQLDGGYTAASTVMDAYVRFNEHNFLMGTVAAPAGL